MNALQFALIGAGNRGMGIFANYALEMPHRAKFIAVVEPDPARRHKFAELHQLPPENCFADCDSFFAANLELDGVIIATLENFRFEPLRLAMEKSYNILIEKPLCTTPEELAEIEALTRDYSEILIVCHQMRLTPVYREIKSLVSSGRFGEIVCIRHSENLAYSHMAHSFVRGLFSSDHLTPMLLQKSCHDLDLISFIIGESASKIASFGALKYFVEANAPAGAPNYCLEGCPVGTECPYNVLKLYFEPDTDPAYIRQMGVINSKAELFEALRHNQFGRCVFHCDNNVVDNQTVQIEYPSGIHVSFTMCGHNGVERRMTKISMTKGEIVYDGLSNTVSAYSFSPLKRETIDLCVSGSHAGGDRAIMDNFVDAIISGDRSLLLTPITQSYEGHWLVFAAEESRKTGKIIQLDDYRKTICDKIKK